MPVTNRDEKIVKVSYIHYLIGFQDKVKVLLDSSSKANAINFNFAQELGLHIRKIIRRLMALFSKLLLDDY